MPDFLNCPAGKKIAQLRRQKSNVTKFMVSLGRVRPRLKSWLFDHFTPVLFEKHNNYNPCPIRVYDIGYTSLVHYVFICNIIICYFPMVFGDTQFQFTQNGPLAEEM
jgi:hypothetical protein